MRDWRKWLAGESRAVPRPHGLKAVKGGAMRGAMLDPAQRAMFVARFGDPTSIEMLLELLAAHAGRIMYDSMTELQLSPAHVEWNRARVSAIRQLENEIRRMVLEAARLNEGVKEREFSAIPEAGRKANPKLFRSR